MATMVRQSLPLQTFLVCIILCCVVSLVIQNWLLVKTLPTILLRGVATSATTLLASASSEETASPIKIAYVVSLIKCSKAGMTTGFIDAAAILRHSIHKHSVHYKARPTDSRRYGPPGRYSYDMIAIVHAQCAQHAPALQRLGYTTVVKDNPVQLSEIRGEWFRTHVMGENCCGADEFIKLYAYTFTDYPIFVHLDMDVILLQPLDDLFDAMLFSRRSSRGLEARRRIQSYELEYKTDVLPTGPIDAFFTRDITSSYPWESKKGVQGGFLVARPNMTDFRTYAEIIREGNYTRGRGDGTGWAALGYGGFQGAMAFQGIVAYFYDIFRPNTYAELNVCRWNQVVADVIWRGPDRYDEYNETCRRFPRGGIGQVEIGGVDCEDCRVTPPHMVKTMHYTARKKPWECLVPHPRVPRDKRQVYRLSHLTNITTCMLMHKEWFQLRREFEDALVRQFARDGKDAKDLVSPRVGDFEKESFLGYCYSPGGYIPMIPPPDDFSVNKLYF